MSQPASGERQHGQPDTSGKVDPSGGLVADDPHQRPQGRRKWWILGAFALAAACAILGATIESVARCLPPPTGPFAVGRTTFYWIDGSRLEPGTDDPHDFRQVRADLWYPAQPGANTVRAAYFPDLKKVASELGMERFILGRIRTHAYEDPPPPPPPPPPPLATADSGFPVVLFSPGNGNNGTDYTALTEELVSHGFVVVTVDHSFQSRAVAYPDGTVVTTADLPPEKQSAPEERENFYRQRVDARVADLRFVLNQLEILNRAKQGRFGGRLDLEHVGAIGHSIGGVAAAQVCLADARFRSAVNLDGRMKSLPFVPDARQRVTQRPFLDVTKGEPKPTDVQLANWHTTREEFDVAQRQRGERLDSLMRSIAGGSYRVTISGLSHMSFGDVWLWYPGRYAYRHGRMQMIRDVVVAFLQKTLRGEPAPRLDETSAHSIEMQVERFGDRQTVSGH